MATNNQRGVTLPSALIRPTPETRPLDQGDEESAEPVDQGKGEQRPSKSRKRRPVAPVEKTNKRGVYLTDAVWDRLQYEAIRRKTTVSAIAGDVLDRNLPRFKIEREG
jgi:macrodomain Ter protein organizer (MatP/YcbG family)